jgi:hypothetical protein
MVLSAAGVDQRFFIWLFITHYKSRLATVRVAAGLPELASELLVGDGANDHVYLRHPPDPLAGRTLLLLPLH